jgi:uncharacterized OB-fold protein
MIERRACHKCGSDKIIRHVHLKERGHGNRAEELTARMFRNPGALFFKGAEESALRAEVCGACGYVELYVKDPESLWSAHEDARRNLTQITED